MSIVIRISKARSERAQRAEIEVPASDEAWQAAREKVYDLAKTGEDFVVLGGSGGGPLPLPISWHWGHGKRLTNEREMNIAVDIYEAVAYDERNDYTDMVGDIFSQLMDENGGEIPDDLTVFKRACKEARIL